MYNETQGIPDPNECLGFERSHFLKLQIEKKWLQNNSHEGILKALLQSGPQICKECIVKCYERLVANGFSSQCSKKDENLFVIVIITR